MFLKHHRFLARFKTDLKFLPKHTLSRALTRTVLLSGLLGAVLRNGTAGGIHFLHRTDDFRSTHRTKLQLRGTIGAKAPVLARFYPDRGLHVEAQRARVLADA